MPINSKDELQDSNSLIAVSFIMQQLKNYFMSFLTTHFFNMGYLVILVSVCLCLYVFVQYIISVML